MYGDRQMIEQMSREGKSILEISKAIGVHRDTIYKEFTRCNCNQDTYDADKAQKSL